MGKATVNVSYGQGRYSVNLVRNVLRAQRQKDALTARSEALAQAIVAALSAEASAKNEYDAALVLLNDAIYRFSLGMSPPVPYGEITSLTSEAQTKASSWHAKEADRKALEFERASVEKSIAMFERVIGDDPMLVWCADYSESLFGEVGTIEINGEGAQDKHIVLTPGGTGGVGHLEPVGSSTPSGSYYNRALFPAWQKWKPHYRKGVITALDHDTDICSVLLDPAFSSEQRIDIDLVHSLTGVPIKYMT